MKYPDKPSGLYKSQGSEDNCTSCAYLVDGVCSLRDLRIQKPDTTKCRDFLCDIAGLDAGELDQK